MATLTVQNATHLLRRAAARGTRQEAEQLASMGLEAAIDSLLKDPAVPGEYRTQLSANERGAGHLEISQKWLNHWLTTPTPAAERLVLFWHGHLVSEVRESMGTQPIDHWQQFGTFRQLGYGPYGGLLKAIAKDPAMLHDLNNNQSRKEHPNENWARELMELFTTGPGNYTEQDIREAAKAFTGWTTALPPKAPRGKNRDPNIPLQYAFKRDWHDKNTKTFMGKRIKDGEDVLNILIEHPKTYEYVGRKLLKFYLTPQPSEKMVQEGAKVLRGGTREMLRWLFAHPEFYALQHRNSLIKSPIEYILGLLYAAGEKSFVLGKNTRATLQTFAAMGQVPFEPPNVAGWDGGMTWLAESPLLVRLNLLSTLAGRERKLDLSVFMDDATGPLSLVKPEAQLL
jgi:uncharacterized protein (DUF1800 family)